MILATIFLWLLWIIFVGSFNLEIAIVGAIISFVVAKFNFSSDFFKR